MPTTAYTLENIAIVNTLGYNAKEKEATNLALVPLIEAGVKFAVLCFDDGFMLQCHNLTEQEQKSVLDEIVAEYHFCLRN